MSYYLTATLEGWGSDYSFTVESPSCTSILDGLRAVAQLGPDVSSENSYCVTGETSNVPAGTWLELYVTADDSWHEFLLESVSTTAPVGSDSETIAALQSTVASLQTTVATTQQTLAQTAATIAETQTGLQSLLNAAAEDFDPVFAGAVFGFFYCTVLVFYSITKGIGAVLAAIKGGR